MTDQIEDAVRKARSEIVAGALKGLVVAGEDLLGEAQRRAPLEEGTLRGSAALAVIVNGQRFEGSGAQAAATAIARREAEAGLPVNMEVEVSFNTIYAARQHEELTWRHPLAGEAKYLERPLVERAGRYENIIRLSAAKGANI